MEKAKTSFLWADVVEPNYPDYLLLLVKHSTVKPQLTRNKDRHSFYEVSQETKCARTSLDGA